MRTEAIWIDAPIAVKCLRARCRRPETYVVVRPLALSVPSYEPDEAPVVLDVRVEPQSYADLTYGKTASLRRTADGWWGLQNGVDRQPAETLDTMRSIMEVRDGRNWEDTPFSINERYIQNRKVEVFPERDFVIAELMSDLTVDTEREATALSRKFCLVGGALHRRRVAPSIVVRVMADLQSGTYRTARFPGECTVSASVRAAPPADTRLLVHQSFRADRIDQAIEYANRVGEVMRCNARLMSYFEPTPAYAEDGDDYDDFVDRLARVFPERAAPYVGYLPTPAVEEYLRLRDLATDDVPDRDRFVRAFRAFFMTAFGMRDLPSADRLATIMQYDVMRMEVERPGANVFAKATSRGHHLAPLEETAFLLDVA